MGMSTLLSMCFVRGARSRMWGPNVGEDWREIVQRANLRDGNTAPRLGPCRYVQDVCGVSHLYNVHFCGYSIVRHLHGIDCTARETSSKGANGVHWSLDILRLSCESILGSGGKRNSQEREQKDAAEATAVQRRSVRTSATSMLEAEDSSSPLSRS